MRIANGVFLVLFLLLLALPCQALDNTRALTQYTHRIWQVNQGLPQSTIYVVRQTSDGYLWLGTLTGPVRFDGVRFTRVNSFPSDAGEISLAGVPILDIAEDADGNLLLATDGQGLVRIRQNRATRFLPGQRVYRLLIDSQRTLYATTDKGLLRFDAASSVFSQWFDPIKNSSSECRALTEVRWTKGTGEAPAIAIASTSTTDNYFTIFVLFQPNDIVAKALPIPKTATIQALATTADGTLWIATSHGLISLDKDHHTRRFTTADGLADDFVHCLYVAPDNVLWAGTRDGFSRITTTIRDATVRERSPDPDKRSLTVASRTVIDSFRASDGLSQSTVYSIFMDKEGALWVATKLGLNQFRDGRFMPITTRDGLPSNNTGPILQMSDGTIYVGTLDAGLARFSSLPSGEFRPRPPFTTADGLPSNRIQALVEPPVRPSPHRYSRDFYVGTDKGLVMGCLFSNQLTAWGNVTFTESVSTLLFDHADTLWIGTPTGLFSLPKGQQIPAKAGAICVNAMIQRKDRTFAVATDNSVVFLNDLPAPTFTPAIECHAPTCALYEDDDGFLWIGTIGNGLHFSDGTTTHHVSMRDGLFDDEIFSITSDDMGRFWVRCSKGIFVVKRQDLLDFAAGKIQHINCATFTPDTALHTTECKPGASPAIATMHDKRIWFTTTQGIVVFNPAQMPRRLPSPQTVIEEVTVNSRVQPDFPFAPPHTPSTTLSPDRNNLAFRYTALSFIIPQLITFRYQLEGFDESWIDAGGRREAHYTNIPPGHYTFRVQALNTNSTWDDLADIASTSVSFTIMPHFYQRWWFIPSLILLALALAALVQQLRVRAVRNRMQRHTQIMLNERTRIARELHDTLLQGFSGITMGMQSILTRLPDKTLEDLIRDAGTCLREARLAVAGLRDIHHESKSGFPATLETAARQLVAGSPPPHIHLTITPSSSDFTSLALPANIEFNLMRIAREAITNTLKHSRAKNLHVGLSIENDQLLLEIRDDGRGFATTCDVANLASTNHYGLLGMHERAAEINATLTITSPPPPANQGTQITVHVPLKTI